MVRFSITKYMRFKLILGVTFLILLMGCNLAAPISNTPLISSSRTPQPTFTLAPLQFFTLTPYPIKSSTPTFDASHLSTYTPAPAAECPKQTTNTIPVFKSDSNKFCSDTEIQVLDFLNAGGKIESVVTALKGSATKLDLTNDGIPELAIAECSFRIYSCDDGQYIKVLEMGDKEGYSHVIDVKDLNLNGIPELIIGGGRISFQ